MIKKFGEYQKINESFRDNIKGMNLNDMMQHKPSYKDKVACDLINIVTNERRISEKSFSEWDAVTKEIEDYYESNKEFLDDIIDDYESNEWRTSYCAEKIYAENFSNNINESKKKKSFENVAKPDDLKTKMDGVSLGKDKNGYFVYTHRARCKSYPTPHKIPVSKIKFIETTG